MVNDHHGTGEATINSTTLAVSRRRSTPFGTLRGATPTAWAGDKGFIGGTADNTGLTHLGAREYDPTIGRFTSLDPLQDITNPQQWNGYTYSSNNPVNLSDPTGLWERDPDLDDQFGRPKQAGTGHSYHRSPNRGSSVSSSDTNADDEDSDFSVGGIFKGAGKQVLDTVKQPIHIAQGMYSCAKQYWSPLCFGPGGPQMLSFGTDPMGTLNGMWNGLVGPVRDDWNNGQKDEAVGRVLVMVAEAVAGSKGMSKLTEALNAGRAARSAEDGCNSFAPGTAVLMADGTTKPIEDRGR